MINTLIGKKLDQSQKFLENGMRIPVTAILLADNVVLQVKTADKDAYIAVQLGAGTSKKPNKATSGHAKKLGVDQAPLKIKEVRIEGTSDDLPKSGDSITLETVFKPGDIVSVSGTSKGKGFAGVVKRHGFAGGPKTHGQSDRHRAPGSIGQGTTPGRVYKGKRMAGRMGSETVTVSNLVVIDVDTVEKVLYVSGLVPGYKNAWVYVTVTGTRKNFTPLLSVKADSVDEDKVDVSQPSDLKDEKLEATLEKEELKEEIKADTSKDVEEKVKDELGAQPDKPVEDPEKPDNELKADEAIEAQDTVASGASEELDVPSEKEDEKKTEIAGIESANETKDAAAKGAGESEEEKKNE